MKFHVPDQHPETSTAKRILCAIVQEAGGRLESQVRLYKAFYWAHLAYWQKHSGVLSCYPIARMPQGPGIDRGEDLIFELQTDNVLKVEERRLAGVRNPERTFILREGFTVNLTPEERDAIQEGLEKIANKSGTQVSEDSHKFSRSWNRKRDGQLLNIYEDLLTDGDYEEAAKANREARELLADVFG